MGRLSACLLALSWWSPFCWGCSDDEGSGGSSQTTGASSQTGSGTSTSALTTATSSTGVQNDWRCGVLKGNPNICDCLPGVEIANADPVAACPESCCGLYEPGTEDEGCRCNADPVASGFDSCDDFLMNEFPTPLVSVASCPPP
jgi:hypothetical protein